MVAIDRCLHRAPICGRPRLYVDLRSRFRFRDFMPHPVCERIFFLAVLQPLRTARSRRKQLHLLRRAIFYPPENSRRCVAGTRLFNKLLEGRYKTRWFYIQKKLVRRTIRVDVLHLSRILPPPLSLPLSLSLSCRNHALRYRVGCIWRSAPACTPWRTWSASRTATSWSSSKRSVVFVVGRSGHVFLLAWGKHLWFCRSRG